MNTKILIRVSPCPDNRYGCEAFECLHGATQFMSWESMVCYNRTDDIQIFKLHDIQINGERAIEQECREIGTVLQNAHVHCYACLLKNHGETLGTLKNYHIKVSLPCPENVRTCIACKSLKKQEIYRRKNFRPAGILEHVRTIEDDDTIYAIYDVNTQKRDSQEKSAYDELPDIVAKIRHLCAACISNNITHEKE